MGERKNRPLWVIPQRSGPKHADITPVVAKRRGWGDFTPGSGRVQCTAMTRSTGERCRNDAVNASTRCRVHGGHRWALHNQPGGTQSKTTGRSIVRKGLAAIGASGLSPDIPVSPVSPVDRGLLAEAHANRMMSPKMYRLALTARDTPKESKTRATRKKYTKLTK